MAMARDTRDNRDKMTGDSVCSTLSDCSLLERNHFHGQHEKRQPPLESHTDCYVNEDASYAVKDDLDNILTEERGEQSVTFGGDEKEDIATFRSVVMRQFKDDIDNLMHTVAQKVENLRSTSSGVSSGACHLSSTNQPNVYSVVKSGCLSLLLSRVLPPLQEQFEQRLMDSLHTAGLLPDVTEDPLFSDQLLRHQPQRPQPPPMPAPRPRTNVESWLRQAPTRRLTEPCPHYAGPIFPGYIDTNHSGSVQHQPQLMHSHPPPRPTPRLLASSESATVTRTPPLTVPRSQTRLDPPHLPPPPAARQYSQCQGQNRISSPYFVHQKSTTTAANSRTATSAVRNNSSLKPPSNAAAPKVSLPLHRMRQPPPPPPSLSCRDLVHTFLIRDSPMLRTILFDPDDRKIKSFSQRYGCYISLFERTRRAGHLLHKVVVRAPSEKALRMCISALDSGLNWDLASQLNRTNKKPVPSLAK